FAEISRRHNDLNILCLSGDTISQNALPRIIEIWMKTPFDGGRHQVRIDKIKALEDRNFKPIN
ncbi:MAG: RpiB/LacA/LacB family sugar-phosphate isomerase, partial [Thermoguttaceae bacterium]|nr:RpiB/LacA/LacB family sugar-phosphate isomerase [Thermoguttaceae bacterium]